MADTSFGTGHPLTRKVWSELVYREALKLTHFSQFVGGSDALVTVKEDLRRGKGDSIYCALVMTPTGAGVSGDNTLEGNEEALVTYRDTVLIDQLRHAHRSEGAMSDQRTIINFREEARKGLGRWWADRIDTAFFNQLAGNTTETDTRYLGSNATIAPSSAAGNTRILYGAGDTTTENSLSAASASCNFQLTMLDKAVTHAKLATPAIEPIRTKRGLKYVVFLHPHQTYSLKTDATAARVTWYDYSKAIIQGGGDDRIGDPEWGYLGEYNNVLIHENSRVPLAPSTTTVRRAIFCGKQALCVAYGKRDGPNRMDWVEKEFDYNNKPGIAAGMVWGLKKMVWNSIDYGTIVLASHAEAP